MTSLKDLPDSVCHKCPTLADWYAWSDWGRGNACDHHLSELLQRLTHDETIAKVLSL